MTTANASLESTPFNEDNLEERLIVALLLDTSSSMQGKPIVELIKGLGALEQALKENEKTRKRVELLLITFGGTVTIVDEFVSAETFHAPALVANGGTPMGEAILLALQKMEARKAVYKVHDIDYLRPLMIMISDGEPTDESTWETAVDDLIEHVASKKVHFQAIGVLNANMAVLKQMSPSNEVIKLNDVKNFEDYFKFLSKSVDGARPHDQLTQSQEYAGFASVHAR